jgi:hypothetical protein
MKPMASNSWILMVDGDRKGLVVSASEEITVLGKPFDGKYKNLADLESKIGSKITIDQPTDPPPEKEAGEVNGYPIKHSTWHNVMIDPVPSYTRTANSDLRYAAGYYGLRFQNGWTQSFCPKFTTLAEYEYIGPFTTKLEMQHQISAKNKAVVV